MSESIASSLAVPAATSRDVLTEVLRDGAQRLLGQAVEAEVQVWLESHRHIVDKDGHRQVVGNGRMPARTLITGVGPVEVRQRRVHDRRILGENDEGQPTDAQGQIVERFDADSGRDRRRSVRRRPQKSRRLIMRHPQDLEKSLLGAASPPIQVLLFQSGRSL